MIDRNKIRADVLLKVGKKSSNAQIIDATILAFEAELEKYRALIEAKDRADDNKNKARLRELESIKKHAAMSIRDVNILVEYINGSTAVAVGKKFNLQGVRVSSIICEQCRKAVVMAKLAGKDVPLKDSEVYHYPKWAKLAGVREFLLSYAENVRKEVGK